MTEPRHLPEISSAWLRDQGSTERVDRVWGRLRNELSVRPQRRTSAYWWAPAAAVALFGAGVFVGAELDHQPTLPPLQAEPDTQPAQAGGNEPAAPRTPERQAEHTAPKKQEQTVRRRHPVRGAPAVAASAEPIEAAPGQAVVAPEPVEPAEELPHWQLLASQLDYEAAGTALQEHGGFTAALPHASPDQLMILHDIARATSDRVHAVEALRQVVELYPEDPNAPIAAWSLGNMLDSTGDQLGAAQAYAAYRALSPEGDFAEDALARQAEVALQRGGSSRARQLASQYVQDFPNGRHADDMRALLSAGTAESAADEEAVEQNTDEPLVPEPSGGSSARGPGSDE